MILHYSSTKRLFWLECRYEERGIAEAAGFEWHSIGKRWVARSPYTALSLYRYADYPAGEMLSNAKFKFDYSFWSGDTKHLTHRPGGTVHPYQFHGYDCVIAQFTEDGARAALIADLPGLGKSCQAILVADNLPGRLLVICPASLRVNWSREMAKWSEQDLKPAIIRTGADEFPEAGPTIISYDLAATPRWAKWIASVSWGLAVLDECHYLKNQEAKRSRMLLGTSAHPGALESAAHVLLLSGTPIPNRPHESWYILKRLAPEVIDNMSEAAFRARYCVGFQDAYGWRITGARNQQELGNRLRGSGFMVRRSKESVLPQLPPKRYNMVVFPKDDTTARIIEKEQAFNADEIAQHGVPVGCSALPELRREMGIAKVEVCASWIADMLDGGADKMLVFAHHTDVLQNLHAATSRFNPALVCGKTSMTQRQAAVDAFQNDPEVRLLIGSPQPAGVGWTLTAAHNVVFVEASWVPSDNEQCVDRVHRIGQTADSVGIWFLVVEESLDAQILGRAAEKAADIQKVLDGRK